jgi:hypothetical protein
MSVRLFFWMYFIIKAFCMRISLTLYLTLPGRRFARFLQQIRP